MSLGALVGGGAAVASTGAFSTVEAERDVGVSVASDSSAYLSIEPGDQNGDYLTNASSAEAAINFTSENDTVAGGGEGVNTNALSTFADVFKIRNQGTQDVEVRATPMVYLDIDLFDGVLAAFLIPRNADSLELTFDWIFPDSLIGIKELSPGDALEFGVATLAFPEDAIDSVSVSDELEIQATEV